MDEKNRFSKIKNIYYKYNNKKGEKGLVIDPMRLNTYSLILG